jgi:PEP-CTERM motif
MTLYGIARASTAVAILVAGGFISPATLADTVQTFTLENTSATDADDVTVYFKQPITKQGKNETSTGDSFDPAVYASPPSRYGLTYGPPLKGGTTIGMGDTFKFTVTTSAGSLQLDKSTNLTYFTNNKAKINDSAKQVSANIDLNSSGGTTVVTVSNPTTDVYEFLTNIEIWTGLSESAAENYALNWTAPGTTPNFTPADIDLSPGMSDPISIGPEGGNYDLVIYDFAFGPSASSSLATSVGIMTFAGTAPEPSTWVMLLIGFGGLSLAARRAQRAARPTNLRA